MCVMMKESIAARKRRDPVCAYWYAKSIRARQKGHDYMLTLSDILINNDEIASFDELLLAVQQAAAGGERFFRMDVKPPFADTPDDSEERLEAAFSGLIR